MPSFHSSPRATLLLACLATGMLGSPMAAQVVVLDEGTFSLWVAGSRVGREDFSIRRSGAGDAASFVAQGNVLIDETRVSVALSADTLGNPTRFELKAYTAGRMTANVSGESRRGLWSARAQRPTGESAREFRLPAGSVGAEDDVVHQMWFLVHFAAGRTTLQLLPRQFALRTIHVEEAGRETVTIGGTEFDAHRWVLRAGADSMVLREAWTDEAGRLLRVRVPSDSLEAVREEAPAETSGARQSYGGKEPFLTGLDLDAPALVCASRMWCRVNVGGAVRAGDAFALGSTRDRAEEQSDLPAVGVRADAGGRGGARGLRPVAPEPRRKRERQLS